MGCGDLKHLLALATDLVGVTLGTSCMAAICATCAWDGWRGHAATISGVTAIEIFVSGFIAVLSMVCWRYGRRCWWSSGKISIATEDVTLSRSFGIDVKK